MNQLGRIFGFTFIAFGGFNFFDEVGFLWCKKPVLLCLIGLNFLCVLFIGCWTLGFLS